GAKPKASLFPIRRPERSLFLPPAPKRPFRTLDSRASQGYDSAAAAPDAERFPRTFVAFDHACRRGCARPARATRPARAKMKYCDACNTTYPKEFQTCPKDQAVLRTVSELRTGMVIRDKYQILE